MWFGTSRGVDAGGKRSVGGRSENTGTSGPSGE